jgi:phosphoribosylanthranilate isomerase
VVDLLQFHGAETPEFCQQFGRPWMKALAMRPGFDLRAALALYGQARGMLLDAWHPDQVGGTGLSFDWSMLPPDLAAKVVLAGGLHPDNVGSALRLLRPWAVDVSSGIESAPGIKDSSRMAAFVAAVQQEEQHDD